MLKRMALSLAAAAVLAGAGLAQQPPSIATLKTTAEASEFKSTSTYEDVVRFMKAVDAASPTVFYTTYGKTYEGREMPMAVVGTGLKDASPAAVRATNKLRVHIQGNIHAGEVEGKESAQVLLRELALGQHKEWLQSMVLLITPIFNADGNERFSLTNRQRQNGPINGMGTRQNAQGLNINRDFMKLETPEGRAFVKLWLDYDPHVAFDLHTSDGSCHGYYLTYSPPLNPNTSDAIMNLMKGEWFPSLTKSVKSKHGWDMFYYGNTSPSGCPVSGRRGGDAAGGGRAGAGAGAPPAAVPQQPAAEPSAPAWGTFEHVPRFHNNYVGMRNRFALLSEAYSYATFEDRIKATNYFVEEALAFAHTNAERLKKVIAGVDKEPIVGKTLSTRSRIKAGPMIEILMGDVEDEVNPLNGAVMWRRKNVIKPVQMIDRLWFEPTASEVVGAEYFVPAGATKALELLRAHGVELRQLTQPVSGVEQFAITGNAAAAVRPGNIDTGTHGLRTLQGEWLAAAGVTAPAGAWAVPMSQPLARLAFYLLAPTSDDGLTTWNYLDDLLTDAKVYPILRKR
jgi:Zinc carboxypeptidase